MIRPIIHRPRRRFANLHNALNAIAAQPGTPQVVPIPEDVTLQYAQKYAHMLAARCGMRISTRALRGRGGLAFMFVTERVR
jgi:hypothetical protein